jgi:hypothetical protein
MDFRRVIGPEDLEPNRYRPLELSINMPTGRLSPLPDFSDWDMKLPGLQAPEPAMTRNSLISPASPLEEPALSPLLRHDAFMNNLPGLAITEETRPRAYTHDYLITVPTQPTASPEHQQGPFQAHARSRSAPSPSSPSFPLTRTATDNIDAEIRELTNLVEARRQSALKRTGLSPAIEVNEDGEGHVPAIAPAMKMRVRSETLSDIGSAFSVPYAMSNASGVGTPPLPASRGTIGTMGTNFSAPLAPKAVVVKERVSRLKTLFGWGNTRSAEEVGMPFYSISAPMPGMYSSNPASENGETRSSIYSNTSTESVSAHGTAISTPMSFSPTRMMRSPEGSISSSQLRRTGLRKRGVSVDTMESSSSVDTSILAFGDDERRVSHTQRELRRVGMKNPLREHPVGAAF